MRFRIPAIFALPLLPLVLASCGSPTVMQKVTTTGGKVMSVSLGPRGYENGKADGYEVVQAFLTPATDSKEVFYQCVLAAPKGVTLARVQIDDVSEEEAAFPVLDDQAPTIKDGRWEGKSARLQPGAPHLQWVYTITTTLRIYRFTLTDSTGKKTEILHASGYPDFVKSIIRKKWGENY